MVRPTFIDMNLVEFELYPLRNSLNKCTGSCNVLSSKRCAPKEKKDISFKSFNIIANKNEANAMTEHILCDCKCKFNSTTCNSDEEWNIKSYQCECKNYCKCKKGHSWNPSTCICENSKYLKSIADTSVTECAETHNYYIIYQQKRQIL